MTLPLVEIYGKRKPATPGSRLALERGYSSLPCPAPVELSLLDERRLLFATTAATTAVATAIVARPSNPGFEADDDDDALRGLSASLERPRSSISFSLERL